MTKLPTLPALLGLSLMVSGCSNTGADYRPIVDGPQTHKYETDLAACRDLAHQRSYTNDDVATDTLTGGVLGTLLGAASEGWGGALAGSVIGAGIGGGSRAYETQEERKQIIVTCMSGRGHKVVG